MEQYGYIRVSAKDQNPERQLIAIREQGVLENNIFIDKMSGKDFKRPQYLKLLNRLQAGDMVIIKSIDRLGRNYDEILEQWRYITKDIGVGIRVLDMPLLNSDIEHENLTGIFISDLVLQILAYVAETERAFIHQRQKEGIQAAKEKGLQFGPRRIELDSRFDELYEIWRKKEISGKKAAEQLKISTATFYRRCKEKQDFSKK